MFKGQTHNKRQRKRMFRKQKYVVTPQFATLNFNQKNKK